MKQFNIYAGLSGGFGGASYRGTGEFKSLADAEEEAYMLAIEEYEMHEGNHGIMSWHDIAEENNLDTLDDSEEIDELPALLDEVYTRITENDSIPLAYRDEHYLKMLIMILSFKYCNGGDDV